MDSALKNTIIFEKEIKFMKYPHLGLSYYYLKNQQPIFQQCYSLPPKVKPFFSSSSAQNIKTLPLHADSNNNNIKMLNVAILEVALQSPNLTILKNIKSYVYDEDICITDLLTPTQRRNYPQQMFKKLFVQFFHLVSAGDPPAPKTNRVEWFVRKHPILEFAFILFTRSLMRLMRVPGSTILDEYVPIRSILPRICCLFQIPCEELSGGCDVQAYRIAGSLLIVQDSSAIYKSCQIQDVILELEDEDEITTISMGSSMSRSDLLKQLAKSSENLQIQSRQSNQDTNELLEPLTPKSPLGSDVNFMLHCVVKGQNESNNIESILNSSQQDFKLSKQESKTVSYISEQPIVMQEVHQMVLLSGSKNRKIDQDYLQQTKKPKKTVDLRLSTMDDSKPGSCQDAPEFVVPSTVPSKLHMKMPQSSNPTTPRQRRTVSIPTEGAVPLVFTQDKQEKYLPHTSRVQPIQNTSLGNALLVSPRYSQNLLNDFRGNLNQNSVKICQAQPKIGANYNTSYHCQNQVNRDNVLKQSRMKNPAQLSKKSQPSFLKKPAH